MVLKNLIHSQLCVPLIMQTAQTNDFNLIQLMANPVRYWIHVVHSPPCFKRLRTFLTSCLFSFYSPSKKGLFQKTTGANSVLLEWTPFDKGSKNHFDRVTLYRHV